MSQGYEMVPKGIAVQLVFEHGGITRTPVRYLMQVPKVGEYVVIKEGGALLELKVTKVLHHVRYEAHRSVQGWDFCLHCGVER